MLERRFVSVIEQRNYIDKFGFWNRLPEVRVGAHLSWFKDLQYSERVIIISFYSDYVQWPILTCVQDAYVSFVKKNQVRRSSSASAVGQEENVPWWMKDDRMVWSGFVKAAYVSPVRRIRPGVVRTRT